MTLPADSRPMVPLPLRPLLLILAAVLFALYALGILTPADGLGWGACAFAASFLFP